MAGQKIVSGLLIRGLSVASSEYPTLFVDAPLAKSTIPAGLGPLSDANLVISGRLAANGISGSTWTGGIREPVFVGSAPTARLLDDATGTLSRLLAADAAWRYTNHWTLDEVGSVAKDLLTLVLRGPVAPTASQIVYLGSEAIKIGAVATSGKIHTCTSCVRARCGSRAIVHSLDPDSYPPGSSGIEETLIATSRPLFDDTRYEAVLVQFRMTDADPEAVESAEWVWFGHVSARPTRNVDNTWSVPVAHVSAAIKNHSFGGQKGIELSHVVWVNVTTDALDVSVPQGGGTLGFNAGALAGQFGFGGGYSVGGVSAAIATSRLPSKVTFDLTRYEAERIFGQALHKPGSNFFDTTLVTNLNTHLGVDSRVTYEIHCEAGGHPWVFRIDSLNNSGGDLNSIFVHASLVARGPGAAVDDATVTYPAGDGFTSARADGYNAGFANQVTGANRVRAAQGETPPKVTLRPRIRATFVETFLMLCLSGYGNLSNDSTYDVLVGGRGMQLDPAWFSTGSTPANPLTSSEGTTILQELGALLDDTYDYAILPEGNLGAWLKNECYLTTTCLGFLPTTGKLALRLLARKSSSPTALNPIIGSAELVKTTERLPPIRAIILERGIDPVTLEWRYRKPLYAPEARARDVGEAVSVRVWKDGGEFLETELATGPLARLERWFLATTQGSPYFWQVAVSASSGLKFGDQVTWTDATIPTANGLGVTSLPCLVIGVDRDTSKGLLRVRIIEDVLNGATETTNPGGGATAGKIAPRLKIKGVISQVSATRFICQVESVASDVGFNINSSHSETWLNLKDDAQRVRVVNPKKHNPAGATERLGLLEASGTVLAITYREKARKNEVELSFSALWSRGGFTLAADIVVPGAYILLQDNVQASQNPEGVALGGYNAIGYDSGNGADFIQISAASRKPKFDGHRSLIST